MQRTKVNTNSVPSNAFIAHYRAQSDILQGTAMSIMNEQVVLGDTTNLRKHLLQLKGSEKEPGKYYNSEDNRWYDCKKLRLSVAKNELKQDWARYSQDRANMGEEKPTVWPPHLLVRKDKLEAQLIVVSEEIDWLQERIKEAQSKDPKVKTKVKPRHWGGGRLHGNQLVEFSGWVVDANEEGIRCVADKDSPYNGMPIWRLKSQILTPMNKEYSKRLRDEEYAAELQNRKKKPVQFPAIPKWDRESDLIEYPQYSDLIKNKKY